MTMKPEQMLRMFAELFAKSTGYNRGKGGSMHIAPLPHSSHSRVGEHLELVAGLK